MFKCITMLSLIPVFLLLASAQFIPAPTDLTETVGFANVPVRYKQVPEGICELNSSVKSYSGFADVASDQHTFWWFFESRNDPLNSPLTIWFSGGPGSSSMSELFQNFGPCMIDKDLNPVDNPYAWSNESNFLFIDQPMQVGFSYTTPIPAWQDGDSIVGLPNNTCPEYAKGKCGTFAYPSTQLTANSTDNAAPNVWLALQGFIGAFPQYSANGINIASSSYGGHYGPVFSQYIQTQNAALPPGATYIDLRTLMIYNGWYDPLSQNIAYYNYSVNPGNTYDLNVFTADQADEMYNNLWGPGNCIDQTNLCYSTGQDDICSKADSFCGTYVQGLFLGVSGRYDTDIRELTPDPLIKDYYFDYLNKPSVQQAIGVFTNYSDYPITTTHAFVNTGDDSREVSSIQDLQSLLDHNMTITLFAGDADFECNWIGGEVVAFAVNAPGFDQAGYTNLSTSDGVVHASVRQAGSFSFTRVYQAGHEVPIYQPLASLAMISRALKALDIATGTVQVLPGSDYITEGPQQSLYREGNSTVEFHRLPKDATYNTTTNKPNIPHKHHHGGSRRFRRSLYL